MNEIQAYVGVDVHRNAISIAVAEAGRQGEARSWGAIPHETTAINRLIKKLHKKLGTFECVYASGPCGCGLQRHLAGLGVACRIVAPSKVPV